MSHFAKIENGIVTQVIVAEQDVIDSGLFGEPSLWIQTSYNTYGNVHYGADKTPDGGIAVRANYASIGFIYDKVNDVFYAPKPYESWILDNKTWLWNPPIPYPNDGNFYEWNESNKEWILRELVAPSPQQTLAENILNGNPS